MKIKKITLFFLIVLVAECTDVVAHYDGWCTHIGTVSHPTSVEPVDFLDPPPIGAHVHTYSGSPSYFWWKDEPNEDAENEYFWDCSSPPDPDPDPAPDPAADSDPDPAPDSNPDPDQSPPPPPVQESDLVVEQVSVSKSTLASGEDFTLSATVKNQGEARTDGTTLRYYRSTDATISSSDTEVGTDSVSSLSANRTGDESIRLTAPTLPGTYYYGACVDTVANESHSRNNCSTAVSITVEVIDPTIHISTPTSLTETTLEGSEIRLTLRDGTYEALSSVMVSGIGGVTVGMVRRVSDTEIAVVLAFDGTDFDIDATLTVTVEADAIANYDGSALTAEVPVTAIKEFDFDLSVSADISLIHVPLKVTAVDGVAKTIESISDLYDALGGANTVNFLTTYESSTQKWLSYSSTLDRGTPADRGLTDDMGIVAGMKTTVSVRLRGDALGTNGSSAIGLNQGLNLVGLPLRDSRISRVSDLLALDGIRGNVPTIILADGGDFKTVGRAGAPGDIAITGGQGFILIAQQAGTVVLSGEGWTNVSATTAAPQTGIEVGNTTPVLALRGEIVDERTSVTPSGFRVTVTNLSTGGQVAATASDTEVGYRLTVVDIETMRAAGVGDVLEISAQSTIPFVRMNPLRYAVTTLDVKRGLIRLPELVAYEIPRETQLLANYPNPFNPETWIPYRLAEDAFVSLTIYDETGRVIRFIDVGHRIAAVYESRDKAIYWDGRNNLGESVASGLYFYHLSAGDYSQTRKMLILK